MVSSGFPPIANEDAKTLVLGTLPGQRSLELQQYFAQPRNAFWKIMGHLIGAEPELPYAARAQKLIDHRIAVWDVCEAAHRPGSLDSSIAYSSVAANDFEAFLRAHPRIDFICFNGGKAADLYRRTVLPQLSAELQRIRTETLPSTSSAHASMSFEQKLSRWSVVTR